MIKQLFFVGQSDQGVFAQALFGSAGCFEKTGGAPPFADWETGEALRDNVESITKQEREKNCYILVNALGAGEFYGSNINADWFPWESLAHVGDDYGYKTFLSAHAFLHHKNKPHLGHTIFGDVPLSLLNTSMRRVELIVRLDREICRAKGGGQVIDRIDAGEFPDVSMGCLSKYAKILRKDGSIDRIENVREGDYVITHRGRPQKVISTMVRPHKGTVFHVKPYGHRDPLVLTEEHPLWLIRAEQMECRPSSKEVNRGRKQHVCAPTSVGLKKGCSGCSTKPVYSFDWVRTDEAREGDYLALPLPTFETTTKFTADEARLLGYYLAEGHTCFDRKNLPRALVLSTGLHEVEIHEEIRGLAQRLGVEDSLSEFDAEDRNGKYITINDRRLAGLCTEHCGNGAKTKKLSVSVMGADEETLQLLLGAYANGDGGCYKGSIYLSTASEQLSDQLRIVLARLRCISSVNEIVHKPSKLVQKETVEYQVWVGTDSAWRLTGSRHSPGKSEKINNKRFFYDYEGTTYLMTPIESIEEVEYDDNVFNFGVEGDDSYLVDGLAVHNCKVPWDECSLCLNHSETKDDYCKCMRPPEELRHLLGPNRILPDGRRIFVRNIYPRFFDISFVFIGADKTAKVMAKLAFDQSKGLWLPEEFLELSADAGHRFYIDLGHTKTASALPPCPDRSCLECDHNCGGMAKMASAFGKTKAAERRKVAEIIKDIPAGTFAVKKLPALEQTEPNISGDHLDELAKLPLPKVLGASAVLGMILKPQEFQHLVLRQMGEDDLLEQLEQKSQVFSPSQGFMDVDITLKPGDEPEPQGWSEAVKTLAKYVAERGSFGRPFSIRVHLLRDTTKVPLPTQTTIGHSLLDKLSAAYNGYRRNVLTKLSQATEVLQRDPRLREEVLGEGLGSMMSKTSSSSPLLTLDSVVYMMGAYLEDRRLLHTTAVESVDHSWLS
jgi:hypothetical protein